MRYTKFIALTGVMATASALQAQVVFTDFGVGMAYNHLNAWGVNNNSIGYQEVAMPFVPSATELLTSVDVAFGFGVPGSSATFLLYSDAGGLGSLLATSSPLTPTQSHQDPVSDVNNVSFAGSGVTLVAGTTYWLDAMPGVGGSTAWNQSTTTKGAFLYRNAPTGGFRGDFDFLGAFDVNGSAVPEPGSFAGLLGGGIGLVLLRRRK